MSAPVVQADGFDQDGHCDRCHRTRIEGYGHHSWCPHLPTPETRNDTRPPSRSVPSSPSGTGGDRRGRKVSPPRGRRDQRKQGSGDRGDSGDTYRGDRRTSWSAAELMAASFPEPRWAVPGVVAAGVSVLAGPPKVGKSWLVLGLALAVASGGRALGALQVEQGAVLYLALEDTGRRLQTRMGKMLGPDPAPSALTVTIECEPFAAGGTDRIAEWLDAHPDARLVIIDVLTKMRGAPAANVSAYEADYAAVGHAKALADRYGVAVVLVHHTRQQGADDWMDTVSGTNGIVGAADAVMVLRRSRGEADGALQITGRDVDEQTHALKFVPELGVWQVLDGPAVDHLVSETRRTILAYVREHPGQGPTDIAGGTDLDTANVKKTCQRMASDGQLIRRHGRYHAPPVPAVPAVPSPTQSPMDLSPPLSPPAELSPHDHEEDS